MRYIKRINGTVNQCRGGAPVPAHLVGGAGFVYSSIRLLEVLWNIAHWDVRV